MDIMVLDTNFTNQGIIDEYISFIWTDRFNQYGDFELYIPMSSTILDLLQRNRYLQIETSDHLMIIESLKLTIDVEKGPSLLVSGRSLESILTRRIIWQQTLFRKGISVSTVIGGLITDNMLNPSISNRKISIFYDHYQIYDNEINNILLTGDLQFTGDNLYDAIMDICTLYNIGFKITLRTTFGNRFLFGLYLGADRSYAQNTLPYVEFSPNFDNLINSEYNIDATNYKNVTLVAGEGEGVDRKTETVDDGYADLDRYELYTDARDLSSNTDSGTLSDDSYKQVLRNRGLAKLAERTVVSNFDASVDYKSMYKYGIDYNIGDIVQFTNEFGISARARIKEFIQSDSVENGMEQYPTFEILEED